MCMSNHFNKKVNVTLFEKSNGSQQVFDLFCQLFMGGCVTDNFGSIAYYLF